jgi:TatD DNase family protein
MASDMIRYGMYLGFGGTVTFKNARHAVEVARMIPSDRILLETDCPYLAPVPLRGTRNDSSNIWYVAEKIAEIRNDTAENILAISRENVRTLFGI